MEDRKIPALIALAGVVIAVVVFFFVAGGDTADEDSETTSAQQAPAEPEPDEGSEPDKPEKPEIEVEGGEPVGGPLELEVTQGDDFGVLVTTDAADELHLHGYDVYFDIVPGDPNEIDVPSRLGADVGTGIVELESHTTGVVLAEISVVPD